MAVSGRSSLHLQSIMPPWCSKASKGVQQGLEVGTTWEDRKLRITDKAVVLPGIITFAAGCLPMTLYRPLATLMSHALSTILGLQNARARHGRHVTSSKVQRKATACMHAVMAPCKSAHEACCYCGRPGALGQRNARLTQALI